MLAQYELLRTSGIRCDYLSNTLLRSFPRGLDVEVIDVTALERAAREAQAPEEREHVTPYIYRHQDLFALHDWRAPIDASDQRWTLDTREDFAMLSRVFDAL